MVMNGCFSWLERRLGLESLGNRNARLALAFTGSYALSGGVWGSTVLSNYLIKIPPYKNTLVGLAEGLQGTMQVLVALPTGCMADSVGRDRLLRLASIFGFTAVALFYVALWYGSTLDDDPDHSGALEFALMCLALSTFGCFDGTNSGALEASFQDSILSSERAQMTSLKFVIRTCFNAAGPLLSAILFVTIGDTWTRPELRTVFYVGVTLSLLPISLLLLFRDADSLGHESEALCHNSPVSPEASDQMNNGQGAEVEPSTRVMPTSAADDLVDQTSQDESSLEAPMLGSPPQPSANQAYARYWIPRIILFSDVTFGIASGTTIKFFPLFFRFEVGMSPAQVNSMYCIMPLTIAIFAIVAQRASMRFGRVAVPLFCSSSGILLLLTMYAMGQIENSEGEKLWSAARGATIVVFILRTALMNCSSPLRKSILNDFVPKSERAWFNGLDSITRFSWSGSALLGGWLADYYGYGSSFLLTAGLQSLATLVLFRLWRFRKRIDQNVFSPLS